MYLVCKYGPFKRSHSQQPPETADRSQQPLHRQQQQQQQSVKETRKQTEAADKELQHLNHKIDKILAKMKDDDNDDDMHCTADDLCAICMSSMATMQTLPCGHRVVCRKCFIKTIRSAISDRSLPLKCIVCRASVLKLGPAPTHRRQPTPNVDVSSRVSVSSSSSTPLRSIGRHRTSSYAAAPTSSPTPPKAVPPIRRVHKSQTGCVNDVTDADSTWCHFGDSSPKDNLNSVVSDHSGDTWRTARSLVRNSAATDLNGNSFCRSSSLSAAVCTDAVVCCRNNEQPPTGNTAAAGCNSCHHHRHRLRTHVVVASNTRPVSTSSRVFPQQQQQQRMNLPGSMLHTGVTSSNGQHASAMAAFPVGSGAVAVGAKLTLQPLPIYPARGSAPTLRRAFFATSRMTNANVERAHTADDRSRTTAPTAEGCSHHQ